MFSGEPAFVGRTEGDITSSPFPRRPRCIRVRTTTSGDQQLCGRLRLWAPTASHPVHTSSGKRWLNIRLHQHWLNFEVPDHIVMMQLDVDLHRMCAADWQKDAFFQLQWIRKNGLQLTWRKEKAFIKLPYLESKGVLLAGRSNLLLSVSDENTHYFPNSGFLLLLFILFPLFFIICIFYIFYSSCTWSMRNESLYLIFYQCRNYYSGVNKCLEHLKIASINIISTFM